MRTPSIPLAAAATIGALLTAIAPCAAQTCAITNASGNYGSANILTGSPVTTSTSFSVSCTGTRNRVVRLCIGFSYGTNYGGSTTQRIMSGASNGLTHDLFIDPGYAQVWGTGGIFGLAPYLGSILTYDLTLNNAGAGTTPALPVYGQIYGGQQTAAPGGYTWTTGTPGAQYDYRSGASCPAGTRLAVAGTGTSVWTANVPAMCLLTTASLNFGSQGVLSTAVDAQTSLSIRCTRTTPYTVALSAGSGAGATTTNRLMTGPSAATIGYALYRDAARTQNWGNSPGDIASGTGTGLAQNHMVYGRTPPQTTPAPGAYSDTIIVTVTY